ncbi:hypothetical protein ABT214_03400 [Micromonospora purpureochromogenes]|uniref:hypothetical protein n=1 Tax=Micromonospora purpureochromogenes TaxID=47872 RepID=UPI003320D714
MPNKHQVERAADVAQALVGETRSFNSPEASGFIDLVRRFSEVEFEVPDVPDADGYLFQYGKVNWFFEPTFVLNVVRQLEVVDSSGEHEAYIHVQFEFRYQLDEELQSAGSYSEWWFPGSERSLNSWIDSISRAPIMGLLATKTLREFEIWQDIA